MVESKTKRNEEYLKYVERETPKTKPSFLNSIAQEAILFAKPEIGINVPPPPNFAILSNTPKAVNKIVIQITIILTQAPTLNILILGL